MGGAGKWGYRLSVDADCFEKSIGSHTFCEEWQREPVLLTRCPFPLEIDSTYVFRWSDALEKVFPVVGDTGFQVTKRSEFILSQWAHLSGKPVGFTTHGDYGFFEGYELVNPARVFLETPRRAEIMKMCYWLCRIRGDDSLIYKFAERWNTLCL
jgi:hypothetical protein